MARAIAFLIATLCAFLLLRSTGLTDGMFTRGNLPARDAFWHKAVADDAPAGASMAQVMAITRKHQISLECFNASLEPPVNECRGVDPLSKGGTSSHAVALQLIFIFTGERLTKFETSRRVLK